MFSFVNKKQFSVLEEFLDDPELETSIRELSRRTDTSPRTVSKTVEELEEKSVLSTRKDGKMLKVSKGESFKEVKRSLNITKVMTSGLVEYLETELRPETIILFGSYEKGEDTER